MTLEHLTHQLFWKKNFHQSLRHPRRFMAEVREHSLRNDNLHNFQEKIEDSFQGITSQSNLAAGVRRLHLKVAHSTVDRVILNNNRACIPSPLRSYTQCIPHIDVSPAGLPGQNVASFGRALLQFSQI